MSDTTTRTVQIYRVYIKAAPEAVWEAITSPEWTAKYGYPGHSEYDLRPGGAMRVLMPADMCEAMQIDPLGADGEVVEVDPPHRLVQTWRFHFMPDQVAEGFHELTWDIHAEHGGVTRLTVTHDVTDAPITAAMIDGSGDLGEGGGGWAFVLSDLKTLLETGGTLES